MGVETCAESGDTRGSGFGAISSRVGLNQAIASVPMANLSQTVLQALMTNCCIEKC